MLIEGIFEEYRKEYDPFNMSSGFQPMYHYQFEFEIFGKGISCNLKKEDLIYSIKNTSVITNIRVIHNWRRLNESFEHFYGHDWSRFAEPVIMNDKTRLRVEVLSI